jgi:hypothetical protein
LISGSVGVGVLGIQAVGSLAVAGLAVGRVSAVAAIQGIEEGIPESEVGGMSIGLVDLIELVICLE